MKNKLLSSFLWALLAIYVFFAYHLLLIPLLLEYSLIGVVVGWGSLFILFFILPKGERKSVTIFVLFVIFCTKAFHQVDTNVSFGAIIAFLAVFIVTFFIAKFYGKLSTHIIVSLLFVTLILNFTVPREELRIFNHFSKVWESPSLYTGDLVDYFPLFTYDINGDGKEEIITFGDRDESAELYVERLEQGIDPNRMPYDLTEDKVFLYVYEWNGSEMVRIDNETLDIAELRALFPKDYIGFPYYVWDENFTLVPQVSRQELSEKIAQFGTMPFYTMDMNMNALKQYAKMFDGVYSKKNTFRFETDIEEISIENGQLTIRRANNTMSLPTRATKIIDLIRTNEGLGVVLLSDQLEIWTLTKDGELVLTHELSENEISNVMSSEYLLADLDQDGSDEILISSATSRIIRPIAEGRWEILFTSRDESLRFEDFGTIGEDEQPTIVSLSKSKVRNHPLRFLTGYSLTDEGLEQQWKSFVSLINVRNVDVTGDGKNELVATVWGSHKIFVFSKHDLPVYAALISIFGLLVIYSVYRRVKST